MTFDARGGQKSSGSNTIVFGAITLTVVAGAFFAVLSLPQKNPGPAPSQALAQSAVIEAETSHEGFSGRSARNFLAVLGRVDPAARAALDRKLAKARPNMRTGLAFEVATDVLARHKDSLAQASTAHVDDWLNMTRRRLKAASRANHRWCDGRRYQAFDGRSSLTSQMAAATDLADLGSELTGYTLDSISLALEAIEDARQHPVRHGPLTHSDEAALQGVAMSMMSDPQVMPLMMASGRGRPPEELLARLDMCELGATAVTALKTLPQGTKGRVFAEMVREANFDSDDLGALSSLPNL
ncbi:MAG: hypothetical protein R3265_00190 [Hyphomonas sp.]|nr:hypothetical protein [Hyphomonas sp.]